MDDVVGYLAKRREPLEHWFAAVLAVTGTEPPFHVALPPAPSEPATFLAAKIEPLLSLSHKRKRRVFGQPPDILTPEEGAGHEQRLAVAVVERAVLRALDVAAGPRRRAGRSRKTHVLREYLPSGLRLFESSKGGTPAVRDFRAYARALYHALFFVGDLVEDVRFYAELALRRLEPRHTGPPVSVRASVSLDNSGEMWDEIHRIIDDVDADRRELESVIQAALDELRPRYPAGVDRVERVEGLRDVPRGEGTSLEDVGAHHDLSAPAVLKQERLVRETLRLLQHRMRGISADG